MNKIYTIRKLIYSFAFFLKRFRNLVIEYMVFGLFAKVNITLGMFVKCEHPLESAERHCNDRRNLIITNDALLTIADKYFFRILLCRNDSRSVQYASVIYPLAKKYSNSKIKYASMRHSWASACFSGFQRDVGIVGRGSPMLE